MSRRNLFVAVFVLSLFIMPLALTDEAYSLPDGFVSYYDKLTTEEKEIFDLCEKPYGNGETPLDRDWEQTTDSVSGTDQDTVNMVAKLMVLENPGLYWLWIPPTLNGDDTLSFTPVDGFDSESLDAMESFVNQIKANLEIGHSVKDAATAVNAKLTANTKLVVSSENNTTGTAFGAIVLGEADAFGFAAAFNYAMNGLELYGDDNVNILTVVGKLHNSKGYDEHAWNLVRDADGDWYGVDAALNKKENTGSYVMTASNDRGNKEGYTFAASHQSGLSEYLDSDTFFDVPEPYMREIIPPAEPTAFEKYGPYVIVISIISVLCIVMIVYSRRG